MMKKLLSSAFAVTILFGGLFAVTSAHTNNDCKEVEFSNETVCVSINKVSTDRFELVTEKTDGTTHTLRCDLMFPDSSLKSIANCNAAFTYDDSDSGRIKLRIRADNEAPEDWEDKPSSNSIWTYPQWMYDFDNEEWLDSNLDNSDNNDSSDNLYITASPSSPSENEDVDITVKARNGSSTDTSYRGTVRFKVEKKSGSSSWTTASSSYYDLARTSYTFTSSDRGTHSFSNLVSFNNDAYDYRLVATDSSNDIVGYKIFYLDGNNNDSNGELDNFYVTASPSSPDTDEDVDVTIEARDSNDDTVTDYNGIVNFTVQKYSNGTRTTASSSSYDLSVNHYDFTSSNDGEKTINNLLTFQTDGRYRLVVTDDDDSSIKTYKEFNVNYNGSNTDYTTDNFYVTASPSSPDENEDVDVTIRARDGSSTDESYRGTVRFKVEKKSGSSSWTTASSSYYDLSRTSYTFTSSDDGEHDFSNLVSFNNDAYDYRLVVYDDDDEDIVGYKTFYLNGSNSNDGELDNFYVTASDFYPDTNEYVDITIEARDSNSDTITDYDGRVNFTVQRYSNSSRVSATTTYYTLAKTYYTFTSSDDGDKTLTDLIKFKSNGRYRLTVTDSSDSSIKTYKEFNVNYNNSSSSVDGFTSSELSTVQSMYDSRPKMITDLKAQYSKLRNSTTRKNRSDTFYDDMNDILDDANNKTYDTYDEYYAGFLSRYRYTLSIR